MKAYRAKTLCCLVNKQLPTTVPSETEPSSKVDWNNQLLKWQKNTSIIEFKKILEAKSDIREGFGNLALALRRLVTCEPEDREKMWAHLMIKQTKRRYKRLFIVQTAQS